MADSRVGHRGIILQLSFEDFVLLPLFFVLVFLSIRICIRKLKTNQNSLENKCKSNSCIRCKGQGGFSRKELLAKLDEFVTQKPIQNEALSRLRMSIAEENGKSNDLNIVNQSPTVLHLRKLVPAKPVHSISYDSTDFLGAQFDIRKVQEELADVIEKDYLWSYNDVENGTWKLYYFYNQGIRQSANCDSCPETAKMVSKVTSFMKNVSFGNAAFSFLSQGTTIAPHFGSTTCRLRCHITLYQGNNCILNVGNEKVVYTTNQVLVFDDSFEHSVNHEKGEAGNRIILMLDLWHPAVSWIEREAIEYIYQISV